jgi:hypothetical protein
LRDKRATGNRKYIKINEGIGFKKRQNGEIKSVIYITPLLLLLLLLLYDMDVSCHRHFFLVLSLEPAGIPTAHASSFTLQYFPYCV